MPGPVGEGDGEDALAQPPLMGQQLTLGEEGAALGVGELPGRRVGVGRGVAVDASEVARLGERPDDDGPGGGCVADVAVAEALVAGPLAAEEVGYAEHGWSSFRTAGGT